MNINASIIDQRLTGVLDEIRSSAQAQLNLTDATRLRSLALSTCVPRPCSILTSTKLLIV